MSRRELAEAANAYVWQHTGGQQRINLSDRDIGRYERGEAHWPDHWRRYGLRGALGADSDTDLGFYPNRTTGTTSVFAGHRSQPPDPDTERTISTDTPTTVGSDTELRFLRGRHDIAEQPVRAWSTPNAPNTVDDVRRRSALALPVLSATAIATVAAEPWTRLAHALANPSRVDEQTVGHLQGRTRDFFHREEHTPSRQVAADLRTHIVQITQLVVGVPARFERALMSSLGEALALAMWLAWDSGETATVQRLYEEAIAAAREVDDGPLLACIYAYRSYLADADGDLPAARDLLVNAQGYVRGERNAGTRSWLAAREAEVTAGLSDWTTALRALERALTAYDYAHPYDERSWTGFFTPSRLGSMAVTTYARLNHPDLGSTTEAVIGSLPTTEVKTRAIILADVATAAMLRGDRDQGVELGHRALGQALTQEVTVARQRLRHLHATIGQMPATPALAELDQRLAAHVT